MIFRSFLAVLVGLALLPAAAHAQAAGDSYNLTNPDTPYDDRATNTFKSAVESYRSFNSATSKEYVDITPEDQLASLGPSVSIMPNDPAWDGRGGKFRDKQFSSLAAAGFTTVRVPLTMFDHLDSHGVLDEAWLTKLDWVVGETQRLHLNLIIADADAKACAADVANCGSKLGTLWYDLAEHYRTAPNTVMFELMAEPDGDVGQLWNSWLPDLLAVVRHNNPTRNVIVDAANGGSPAALSALQLPEDDAHLIAGISYSGDGGAAPATFDAATTWAKTNRRPLLLTDFAPPTDGDAAWTAAITKAAKDHGIATVYGRFDGPSGIYNMDKHQFVEPMMDAVVRP